MEDAFRASLNGRSVAGDELQRRRQARQFFAPLGRRWFRSVYGDGLLPLLRLCGQLLKPEVFKFIERHNLHDVIHDNVWCRFLLKVPSFLIEFITPIFKIINGPRGAVEPVDDKFEVFFIDFGNQGVVPYSSI